MTSYEGEIINVPEGTTANPPPPPRPIMEYRDRRLAELTANVQELVGLTIAHAQALPHHPECDGSNVIELTFMDGTSARMVGGGNTGEYPGGSCDEYVELIGFEYPAVDHAHHSLYCGWRAHDHGLDCATTCPTCHGRTP